MGVFKRPVKTALHQAVLDTRLHQVRLLVCKHNVNVDSRDMFGRTPLMLACLLNDEEYGYRMMRILLRAGAYVNIQDDMDRTALHYACIKGRTRAVRRCLREDLIDVNGADSDGNTPLLHACMSGHPDIVDMLLDVLLKFGIDLDARNQMGYTPLLLACKYGNYVSAHLLVTRGCAQPSLRDNEFFFNAYQWLQRSRDLHAAFVHQRALAVPTHAPPRYARENSLYALQGRPKCRHVKTPCHPLGKSLDNTLKLPSIFSHFPLENPKEETLDGDDARQKLMEEIDRLTEDPHGLSGSTPAPDGKQRLRKSRLDSPAKLVRKRSSHRALLVPDMHMLFRLYSDQYGERCATGHMTRHSTKSRHIRIKTPPASEAEEVSRASRRIAPSCAAGGP